MLMRLREECQLRLLEGRQLRELEGLRDSLQGESRE